MSEKPDIWTQETRDALTLMQEATKTLSDGNLREVEVRLEKASLVISVRVRR